MGNNKYFEKPDKSCKKLTFWKPEEFGKNLIKVNNS